VTTGTAGDGRAGSVPLSARSDHRPEASAGDAGADGGLGVPGGALRQVYTDDPGHPPLPTRLMAGLAILKHTYDLSDEVLCERWVENPYYQFFCGEEFFQHRLVFDRSSLTRWRNRMGEERLQALIQESLSVATRTKAIKPSELSRVIVDTTVKPKNVTFPTDAKLLNRAREKLVRLAQRHGVSLRQSYARVGCATSSAALSATSAARSRAMVSSKRPWPSCYCWRGASASNSNVNAGRMSIPVCARSRMHGQGPSALRVRRQGQRCHHPQALQGRPVRHPCEGAAR
jgi:transposase-like protein DUF772